MPLAVGDVLTLTLTARDTAGNAAQSDARARADRALAMDPRTYERHRRNRGRRPVGGRAGGRDRGGGQGAGRGGVQRGDAGGRGHAGQRRVAVSGAAGRVNRRLASAIEAGAASRRALLRATARADGPQFSAATRGGWTRPSRFPRRCSPIFRAGIDTRPPIARAAADHLRHDPAAGTRLRADLGHRRPWPARGACRATARTCRRGRETPAPKDPKAAELLSKTLDRMRGGVAAGARCVGLDAGAGDFDAKLKALSDAARSLTAVTPAGRFRFGGPRLGRTGEARPARPEASTSAWPSAAQQEAVRPDADLARARDLQLAPRAAARLAHRRGPARRELPPGRRATAIATGRQPPRADCDDFAKAIDALQREHRRNRDPSRRGRCRRDVPASTPPQNRRARCSPGSPANRCWPMRGRDAGRRRCPRPHRPPRPARVRGPRRVARAGGGRAGGGPRIRPGRRAGPSLEPATRRARLLARNGVDPDPRRHDGGPRRGDRHGNRRARRRRPWSNKPSSSARKSSGRARASGGPWPRPNRSTGYPPSSIGLADQTKGAAERGGDESGAAVLAERQRAVAAQVAEIVRQANPTSEPATVSLATTVPAPDDATSRERGTAALVAAQQQLAAMPQQLTLASEAAAAWREATRRAESAKHEAEAAPPDRKAAAAMSAAQAEQDAADAAAHLDAADAAGHRGRGPGIGRGAAAVSRRRRRRRRRSSRGNWSPRWRCSASAIKAADGGARGSCRRQARQAIDAAQREVARAEDAFAERDPLVAAKWFARAAADAARPQAAGLPLVRRPPGPHRARLARSWDLSIHRAAAQRLAALPSMRPAAGGRAPGRRACPAERSRPAARREPAPARASPPATGGGSARASRTTRPPPSATRPRRSTRPPSSFISRRLNKGRDAGK